MARSKRAIAGLTTVGVLAAMTLSGCQLLEANAPTRTPTALEACATGNEWDLDMAALAPAATAAMFDQGLTVDVTVEGSQHLTWDSEYHLRFETDLTFTGIIRGGDPAYIETFTANGESTGTAYFANDVAIPRDWSEDLEVTMTATQGGAPADLLYEWFPLWIDDTVGLRVECSPEQMTITQRQGAMVWTFIPAG